MLSRISCLLAVFLALSCAARAQGPATSRIGGMVGPEDLVFDDSAGYQRLLVSSLDRRDSMKSADGRIFEVDLGHEPPRVSEMRIEWPGKTGGFQPHGIALLRGLKPPRLFVINHSRETIEIFKVEGKTLRHEDTICCEGVVKPNDLDARALEGGAYEIFVTNPAQNVSMVIEGLLGPLSSFVTRIRTNEQPRPQFKGFRYANGVAIHPNGRLYVASSLDHRVYVRELDSTAKPGVIKFDSLVDNITVEERGTMLVAGGGSKWTFLKHARAGVKGRKKPAPTAIWRFDPASSESPRIVWQDKDGSKISGGSSAVCVGDNLYIGQVFDDYVLKVSGACAADRK